MNRKSSKRSPLAHRAGTVATEYVLITVALLVAFGLLSAGGGDVLKDMGEALTERLSTTSMLLQLPF